MKNVEKHINEIVSKVLSEQVALKAEEIMSMANEELHGGQKKLDKNKNGKLDSDDFKMLRKDKKEKPRTPAGFEHGEIVSGDVDENEPLYRGLNLLMRLKWKNILLVIRQQMTTWDTMICYQVPNMKRRLRHHTK
jgi:hypothetical protein